MEGLTQCCDNPMAPLQCPALMTTGDQEELVLCLRKTELSDTQHDTLARLTRAGCKQLSDTNPRLGLGCPLEKRMHPRLLPAAGRPAAMGKLFTA